MADNFKRILDNNKIIQVKTRSPIVVAKNESIGSTIAMMQARKRGCAIIQEKKALIGLFTEKDLLTRVIAPRANLADPIEKVMTPQPTYVNPDTSVSWVMQIMSKKGYRHVPIVDAQKGIVGFVSVRDILDFLAEYFPYEVYNLPPDPNQVQIEADGA